LYGQKLYPGFESLPLRQISLSLGGKRAYARLLEANSRVPRLEMLLDLLRSGEPLPSIGPRLGISGGAFGSCRRVVGSIQAFATEKDPPTIPQPSELTRMKPARLPVMPRAVKDRVGCRPVAPSNRLGRSLSSKRPGSIVDPVAPPRITRSYSSGVLLTDSADENLSVLSFDFSFPSDGVTLGLH
jgi:hypothetical protein